MNILIPHQWLLEHLKTQAEPKKIQEILSLSGPSVEHIYKKEGEEVYDIEVTTNRVDSMSIRGIAREASVILNQAGIQSQLEPLTFKNKKNLVIIGSELPLPVINNNPKLCKRVMCVILKNVKKTATPAWMAKRVLQTEMNVHDSAIDITNYITHELGHPCHAFDYDKLMQSGGVINIVEAEKNEKFTTLDGLDFSTVGGEVVFKNSKNEIIDLPSIKGTANTSIDDNTKNVLLLLESIVAPKVRFASMTHAIRTTAAQLMEKNVDPNLAEIVLHRGIELYQQLCRAEIGSQIYDDFPEKTTPPQISIDQDIIKNYLGIELEQKTVISILENLECRVSFIKQNNKIVYQITPPTFRPDLNIPADIIEELARIYGYHNLPSKLMDTPIPTIKPKNLDFELENKIKNFLANIGWQEIYSYSMVSEKIALESGYSLNNHLKLSNPLTEDRVYLRRSLIPSLEEIIEQNPTKAELSVFEMAKIYHPRENDLPNEDLHLTLVSNKDYRLVKGDLASLLKILFIERLDIEENDDDQENQSGTIFVGFEGSEGVEGSVEAIGAKGIVESKKTPEKREVLGTITILSNNHIGIDLSMDKILKYSKKHPKYQPLPNTAQIIEDLTWTLPEKTQIGKVVKKIAETSELIYKIELKDVYKQNHTFSIVYWNSKTNLSNEEIEPIRKKIVKVVENEYNAKLVGEV